MLKEFVQTIAEMARQSKDHKFIPVPGQPHQQLLVCPDGSVDQYDSDELLQIYTLTLSDLAEIVKTKQRQDPFVLVAPSDVTGYLDGQDARHWTQLTLQTTEPWNYLQEVHWQPQKQFLRTLRITFDGCGAEGLIQILQTLEWAKGEKAKGTVQQGKESLGRQVSEEVTGGAEIPEAITLTIPVYLQAPAHAAVVRCAVDIDTSNERFSVVPFPGELKKAQMEALVYIENELESYLEPEAPRSVDCENEPRIPVHLGAR